MDILRLLQTIGICVGALALVAIAIMIFMAVSSFVPSLKEPDEEDTLRYLRGKSREEIEQILKTPVYEPRSSRKPTRTKKDQPDDGKK